jgi:hypothetical protein
MFGSEIRQDWQETLIKKLAKGLREAAERSADHSTLSMEPKSWDFDSERVAAELVAEALRNGLVGAESQPSFRTLDGGNTALQVAIATTEITFVFKADVNSKLVREAQTIVDLRTDRRLREFCFRLPKIYAVHDTAPPYAYLMEHFDAQTYPSIRQIFFNAQLTPPSPIDASAIVTSALDALSVAFRCSKDPRQQIRMMGEAYYERIQKSLTEAAEVNSVFRPRSMCINGTVTRSWRESLSILASRQSALQSIAAPFVTVVHGDPNPGNILVRRDGGQVVDIKFIDVKDWKTGDYLFDIAKLGHFLLQTGPIEDLKRATVRSLVETENELSIVYEVDRPDYVLSAARALESKTAEIAQDLADAHWRIRYELAMASNLLGLVPRRLKTPQVAQLLYSAGMLHLETFINSFSQV